MEDAPTPIFLGDEKPIKQINFELESNLKNNFAIAVVGYNSYVLIKIKNNKFNREYEEKYTLDKFKTLSKYFIICESISEVISSIEPNLKHSKIIEDNNSLELIIELNHPLCKESVFIIPEKIKIFNPTELYYIITEMRNEKKTQQEIIRKQQTVINNLQNNINELTERVKFLEDKIEIINKNNDEKQYLNLSKIIIGDFEKERTIKNWINPSKNLKFELLFRKTRDGSSCGTFHKYCDNKGPTLTLVETNKGYKFGGYTPFSFQSKIGYSPYNDNQTFIFSLNQMQKFNKKRDDSLVYFDPNFGPCFGQGGSDFYIDKDLNCGFTINKSFLTNYELTNGESGRFNIKELEIYKVI